MTSVPLLFRGSNITFESNIPIEKHYKTWGVSSSASAVHCVDDTIRGFLWCVIAGKISKSHVEPCGRKGNSRRLHRVGPGPFLMGRVTMSCRKTCVGKLKILGEIMDHVIRKYNEILCLTLEHVSEWGSGGFVPERVRQDGNRVFLLRILSQALRVWSGRTSW